MRNSIPASNRPAIRVVAGLTVPVSVLLAVLLVVLLNGCFEPQAPPPMPPILDQDLVLQEPVLVVPSLRFSASEGRFSFRNRAALLVWVDRPDDAALSLILRPAGPGRRHHFRFAWNGADLAAETIERGDDGSWRIEMPPGELASGFHQLEIERDYRRDDPADRGRIDNIFAGLEFRFGDLATALDPADLPRYRRLAGFLEHRVTGVGQEVRGGVLFAGPGRHEVRREAGGEAVLRVEPVNLSAAPAIFEVSGAAAGRLELGPEERGVLRLELEGGGEPLVLTVSGAADGLFLWGAPIVENDARSLTPIVLITLDTTRRDALGVYRDAGDADDTGNERATETPYLDRLASRATVYDNAYSTSPWTLPSHASIMTGLYPSKHGAGVSEAQVPRDLPHLARLLREKGYFGAGFSSGDLSSSRFGLAQGFHHYRDPDAFETLGGDLAAYLDAFLDDSGHLPLFLFVNYFDPHALYRAPAEYEARLGVPELLENVRDEAVIAELLDGKMSGWRQLVEGEVTPTPAALDYLEAAYLAEVAYTDHLVGRLMDRLRSLGIYDRALIIVTADHGELLGEGGYVSHGARLDPELVEIPLIVKWPGQEEGRRSHRLTSLVDLYPTILEAAGLAPPPSDGHPLASEVPEGPERSPHRFVFLEEHQSLVHPLPKNMQVAPHLYGVQRSDYRQLVWATAQACARRHDDGWRDAACAGELEDVLAAVEAQLGAPSGGGGDVPISDELRQSLEALGYM